MLSQTSSVRNARELRGKRADLTNPNWVFAAILLLGAAIVLWETRGMSFFGDDWDFVVDRRGLGLHTLLDPHGPHLSLFPILVYKVLLKVFGGGSYLPFRLLSAIDIVLLGLVLGLACRVSWGRWWSLVPVLLLVTLGPAGVSTLWSFQVGFALAVSFGVLSLLALRRRRPWADVAGCICLVISLGSASQGVGFAVGGAFVLALTGDPLRRSWTVVLPALLYVLWYVLIGHAYGETRLGLWPTALGYEMQTLGVTAAALCGLSSVLTSSGTLDPTFAAPFAVAIILAIAVFAWRGWRPRMLFWGAASTAVVIWFAAAVSDFPPYGRPPTEPRYLASDALLVLICLCAATPPPRLPRGGLVIAALVVGAICLTNAGQFAQQHSFFVAGSRQQSAELGALELMRPFVSPGYNPGAVDANLVNDTAGRFFSAVSAFGLRESDPGAIAAQDEGTRVAVDHILAANELLLVSPAPSSAGGGTLSPSRSTSSNRRCARIGATAAHLSVVGTAHIKAGSHFPVTVSARRFASQYDISLGSVAAGSTATLRVAADLARDRPWQFMLTGTGAEVCE